MNSPEVSVIIPTRDSMAWIGQTLCSVSAQDQTGLEVIVVDDASSDGTPDFVEENHPGAQVIRCRDNGGPSRARNRGFQAARGRWIQYLDSDDLLAPGKIRAQREVLEKTGADIAYGDWQELIERSGGTERSGQRFSRRLGPDPASDLIGEEWDPIFSYLFRRETVERSGGWKEEMWLVEDVRFLLDCAEGAARFVRVPGDTGFYRRREGSLSQRSEGEFLEACFQNARWLEQQVPKSSSERSRHRALLGAYFFVARRSYRKRPEIFEKAWERLKRLDPKPVPSNPWRLRVLSRCLGYRRAEEAAYWYRRFRRSVDFLGLNR